MNELNQAALDLRAETNALREKRNDARDAVIALIQDKEHGRACPAEKMRAAEGLLSDIDTQLSAAEKKYLRAERAHLTERSRLAAEDAELMRNPSGRIPTTHPTGRVVRGVGRCYAGLFGHPQRLADQGWGDSSEFFRAVVTGQHPALMASQFVGQDSTGGWLAPEELVSVAFDAALEDSVVLQRARIEPMVSDVKMISGPDVQDSSTGPYGFEVQWVPEGGEIVIKNILLRKLELRAKKAALLFQESNEVLADSGGQMSMTLERALGKAISWAVDYASLQGKGAGVPLGILASPACIEVAKESGQAAASINYANVAKMFARLHPMAIRAAAWYVSSTCLPQLLTLTIPVGTGGSHVPLVGDRGGTLTLFNRPLIETEKLPALGARGDLLLADLSFYVVGLRQQIVVDRSAHVGFTKDLMTFRGTMRIDGQPLWEKPYTPKHGATTSAFVTLAERA